MTDRDDLLHWWGKLTRPRAGEPETARREYLTKVILLVLHGLALFVSLLCLVGWLLGMIPLDTLLLLVLMGVLFGVGLWLANRGYWRFSGYIPPLVFLLMAIYGNYIGGVDAPAMLLYALVIVLTSMLQGNRAQWMALLLCTAIYLGFGMAYAYGYLIPQRSAETALVNRLTIVLACFLGITTLLWFFKDQLQQALSQSQAHLREARSYAEELALFRTLAENAADAIVMSDTSGRLTYVNRAGHALCGYDYERQEMVGLALADLVSARDLPQLEEMTSLQAGMGSWNADVHLKRQDGGSVDANLTAFPVRDTAGQVFHQAMIIRDIAERKRAEEILAYERDLLHTLLDNIPDTIYFKDAKSRFLRVNRAQARVLGIGDPVEAVGRTDFDFFPEAQAREAYADEQRIVALVEPMMDKVEQIYTADGQRRWVSATKVPIVDQAQGVVGIVGISRDITERREAEERLRLLSESLEQMSEGVAVVDLDGYLLFSNQAFAAAHGYVPEELVGKPLSTFHTSEQMPAVEAANRQVREMGEFDGELWHVRRDGSEFPTLMHNSLLRDEEGVPIALISTLRDISERRRLEEQLRQAQKMEAIGTLAGGIAHDFNNILTGILGYASLLQTEFPPGSRLYGDLEAIVRSAERAALLTDHLLTFAQRGQQVEMRPVNLNLIVDDVVALLERTIDRAIVIETHLAVDLYDVKGDVGQLHQVLLNLCLNARDAMPDGGKLIVETANVYVDEVQAVSQLDVAVGPYMQFSVSDTGCGMDPETIERIFDPFFSTKEQGRGLGLSIVYGIVHGHAGAVHVYSEVGQGSCFRVYLPAYMEQVTVALDMEVTTAGGSETVLVVDDEKTVRALLKRILQRGGYTVLQAGDGLQALELYRQRGHEVDLVVLDMVMPYMGGRETFSRLLEINPQVKVLLSSGYSENGQAGEILSAGARGFLRKPYTMEEVLHRVRQALDD